MLEGFATDVRADLHNFTVVVVMPEGNYGQIQVDSRWISGKPAGIPLDFLPE